VSGKTFTHKHRVSYAECTIGNHIYYSRYLDLLEIARGEFFRELGMPLQLLHETGALFPVIEAHIRYRGAARYDDVLRIELWMNEVARVRLNFGARIFNQLDELLIEASTVHACTGTDDKLKRVPEGLAPKLQPYIRAVDAPTTRA
jgi:acyl-CoA thioester hydrolase